MKYNYIVALLVACLILPVTQLVRADSETAPKVGDLAPDFTLSDQNGDAHQLSNYRKQWVVLYFYPKDDTPGCTTEACNFRDDIRQLRALGAQVLGVSVDSVASHADFAAKHGLPFPLLADETAEVAEKYDSLLNLLVTKIAKRRTFLIDPAGIIAKIYQDVDPDGHSDEVISDLKKLQHPGIPSL